ncbi:MAG: hypothetical protein HXX14_02730 [Bacteroidetes bacterium]|nr:hypothetical protein [Bacteroidota bacterium]
MKKLIVLVLIISSAIYSQAQKEKIELNLSKGETYKLNITDVMSMNTPDNGQQNIVDIIFVYNMSCKVVDVQDSIYDIEMKIDSLSNKKKSNSKSDEINNDKVISKMMEPIIGKVFNLKLSSTGIVNQINIDSATLKVLPYTKKTIKEFFEMIPAIYTRSGVSIGEKWTADMKSYFGFFPKIKTTYELKEASNNYLIITGLANYNGSDSQNKSIPDMTGVTSTITSFIKINKKTGWIIDAKINQKAKGPVSSKNDKEKTNVNNQMTVDLEITFRDK